MKVRERAAIIASISASSCTNDSDDARDVFGVKAHRLYMSAWHYVFDAIGDPDDPINPELDAEAEALIRTGWEPK